MSGLFTVISLWEIFQTGEMLKSTRSQLAKADTFDGNKCVYFGLIIQFLTFLLTLHHVYEENGDIPQTPSAC